jgi:hypothetical protein
LDSGRPRAVVVHSPVDPPTGRAPLQRLWWRLDALSNRSSLAGGLCYRGANLRVDEASKPPAATAGCDCCDGLPSQLEEAFFGCSALSWKRERSGDRARDPGRGLKGVSMESRHRTKAVVAPAAPVHVAETDSSALSTRAEILAATCRRHEATLDALLETLVELHGANTALRAENTSLRTRTGVSMAERVRAMPRARPGPLASTGGDVMSGRSVQR